MAKKTLIFIITFILCLILGLLIYQLDLRKNKMFQYNYKRDLYINLLQNLEEYKKAKVERINLEYDKVCDYKKVIDELKRYSNHTEIFLNKDIKLTSVDSLIKENLIMGLSLIPCNFHDPKIIIAVNEYAKEVIQKKNQDIIILYIKSKNENSTNLELPELKIFSEQYIDNYTNKLICTVNTQFEQNK
jgi:hypothetical protein